MNHAADMIRARRERSMDVVVDLKKHSSREREHRKHPTVGALPVPVLLFGPIENGEGSRSSSSASARNMFSVFLFFFECEASRRVHIMRSLIMLSGCNLINSNPPGSSLRPRLQKHGARLVPPRTKHSPDGADDEVRAGSRAAEWRAVIVGVCFAKQFAGSRPLLVQVLVGASLCRSGVAKGVGAIN